MPFLRVRVIGRSRSQLEDLCLALGIGLIGEIPSEMSIELAVAGLELDVIACICEGICAFLLEYTCNGQEVSSRGFLSCILDESFEITEGREKEDSSRRTKSRSLSSRIVFSP